MESPLQVEVGKGVQGQELRCLWLLLEEVGAGSCLAPGCLPQHGADCQASSDHHSGRLGLSMYPVAIVSGVSSGPHPMQDPGSGGGPLPCPLTPTPTHCVPDGSQWKRSPNLGHCLPSWVVFGGIYLAPHSTFMILPFLNHSIIIHLFS